MKIENEASFREAGRQGWNLFLGAGFSVLARDIDGNCLPVGSQLPDELRNEFEVDSGRDLTLPQICTVIEATNKQGLEKYLRKRCTVTAYDPRYDDVFRTNVKHIFTTNIDDLVHRVYDSSTTQYLNDVDFAGSSAGDLAAVDFVALHGSVRNQHRPFKFATLDLAGAYDKDRDRWSSFREQLKRFPTVFLGYGLADAGTLQAITADEAGQHILGDCWMQVREEDARSGVVTYLRALGMQIIEGDTDDFLGLASALAGPTTHSGHAGTSWADEGNIPHPYSVPQRPIGDFFLGAAPTWSDIFSGLLVKTGHFRSVQELIFARSNTIITGIPGCGKTTLLMQLASDVKFQGSKILEENLTLGRAELLGRQLGDSPALILIDDVANDIEAYAHLARMKNLVLVGADRDYKLGAAAHLLGGNTKIERVTDQTAGDLQSIWETIPLRLRTNLLVTPRVSEGVSPSIVEFIEANLIQKTLRVRIEEALLKLTEDDLEVAELLVLSCYVHGCRTPISMDMILGYLGESFINYYDVRDKMVAVGELLHEYTGDLADEPQDYFTARSVMLSEAVLKTAPRKLLRKVLGQLHRTVSPVRIASYQMFKRSAFDHATFGRAFESLHEATELYDFLIARDGNEYIRQQKALFLADRRELGLAFTEIDRARSRIRGRSWSIDNSYYKILFGSNLDKYQDPQALDQMERSLSGLDDCFTRDKRKGMHALVYANCALQYSRKLSTSSVIDHLRQSVIQLEYVVQHEPWLDRPPHVLKEVTRRLNQLVADRSLEGRLSPSPPPSLPTPSARPDSRGLVTPSAEGASGE